MAKIKDKPKLEIRQENPKAKRLMWSGVIFFTIAIAIVWGYGLITTINDINTKSQTQASLWNNTKDIWQDTFQSVATSSVDTIKDKINNLANTVINTSTTNEATSTVTSTAEIQNGINKLIDKMKTNTSTINNTSTE